MSRATHIYTRLGWRVVPIHDVKQGHCSCGNPECKGPGKHPRLNAWQTEASSDPTIVDGWLEQWPDTNLGIATGAGSGFFALDIDPEKGGNETLEALIAEHGPLPHTARQRTGSGGTHYLFKMIPGLRNSAGRLGKGLDTRGDGGQIVVSPSTSGKGHYTWIVKPWQCPIAEAPPWLVELLKRPAVPLSPRPNASTTVRGTFPAASSAVLDHARVVLERLGPAVDGEGGGLKTVEAAMILTHDFALTDEEAFPLLLEWNDTCQPPWEPDGLRVMLGRGRKYGKGEYGARRSLDALETARKALRDWSETYGNAPDRVQKLGPVLEFVRQRARACGDTVKHELIAREAMEATGLPRKALSIPPPDLGAEIPQGAIQVTTQIAEVADKAIRSIAPDVFQRGGVLCEVVRGEKQTFVHELEISRIQDLMSQRAKYVRSDDKGITPQAPPLPIASILAARRDHPVRVLDAVTTVPVFLADGSILQARGYNAQARVFLEPAVHVYVPDEPTQDDAAAAVDMFRDLLSDVTFKGPADFAVWLAGLLSPLIKAATENAPAPVICVSASRPGAGKTLLADLATLIVMGQPAENRTYGGNARDNTEWTKKLTTFVRMGTPISVWDNCNGPFGDEGVDRLITSSTWSDRILGVSEAPPLPNVTTWWATGNNIEPVGDTVRRVLLCKIQVDVEQPQLRKGFRLKDIKGHTKANRPALLTAALTILRAYHCAGRPDQNLPTWGSFEAWSDLVRSAIVWAGASDPFETQARASLELNETEHDAHDFWLTVIDESDGSVPSIVQVAQRRDAQAVLGLHNGVTAFGLKALVRRFVDAPRSGKRICKSAGTYRIERI